MVQHRLGIAAILLLVLFSVFGLSYAWENGLEEAASGTFGFSYDEEFEAEEKWRFIITSTTFATIALVGPSVLLFSMFFRLQRSIRTESEARHAAEAASRAKSAFLANMSHELRTPLNGVLAFSSVLARTPLTPSQAEMAATIESTAEWLDALLGDVLDLSKVEAGRIELAPKRVNLDKLVRQTAALFEAQAEAKGLIFRCEVVGNGPRECLVDPVRLQQILTNLLSNAVKFTAQGQIRLQVTLDGAGDRMSASFVVADTGVGFDVSQTERLFGAFEQADSSSTRRFGGTGLGLAISRSLTAAMGGELTAASQLGLGSTFTLSLDLEAAEPPRAAASFASTVVAAGDGPRPRVLLAEDDPTNRRAVEIILEMMDVTVRCVGDGAQAVMAAQTENFDLILMDIRMPIMDGLSAVRAIRASELRHREYPATIYALSAQALTEEFQAAFDAGVDDYLTKPISAGALQAAVAKALKAGEPKRREVLAG